MDQTDGLSNEIEGIEMVARDPDEPELEPSLLEEFLKNPDAIVTQSNCFIRSVEDLNASDEARQRRAEQSSRQLKERLTDGLSPIDVDLDDL
jgi:hypothetical protein